MKHWLARQAYLVDFIAASLARRKGRNFGLLAVYSLLVFLLASVSLTSQALRQEATAVLQGSPEIILQRLVAGRHDLIPPGYLEQIGRIRGVQQKAGRLWGYFYDPVVKANYTFIADATVPAGKLRLGPTLAAARGLGAGDTLSLRSYAGKLFSFEVESLLATDSALLSADLVLLSEADFRAFFAYPEGHYTDLTLSVANPQEVRNVAAKLAERLPDSRPILREEILRTYASLFDWREGMVLVLYSGVILAFAIFAWDKASGLSAEERHEIGILKAIGWETGDVMRMKLWEGLLVSLAAFLIGYVGAYVHVFHFAAGLFASALQGWSTLYPQFQLVPRIDGVQAVTLLFFTVFPYTVAVLVPIWRAAITDPDAAMRS